MTTYMRSTTSGEVFTTDHPEHHEESAERLTAADGKRLRTEQCKAKLRDLLSPGDTVYSIIRHVSRSGMSRRIDFYIFPAEGEGKASPRYLTTYMADVLGYRVSDKGGMVVDGCGMDMAFHCVYSLGVTLWPDQDRSGYALKSEII